MAHDMTAEEFTLRRAAVLLSALIYWGGVWIQARRIRKRIGRAPNLKPRGPKEKLLWVGWFLVIAVWMGQAFIVAINESWPILRMYPFGLSPAGLVIGLLLLLAGYGGTLWCYVAMGNAWRIGINRKEKNELVTEGPYKTIRHPIYLFQIVMLAGVAFLLPTLLSISILLIHLVCVLIKASDEENYLRTVHGQLYVDYLSRTGRLLPRL